MKDMEQLASGRKLSFEIPMIGGGIADLTIPRTMSRDAYRNLVHVIRMFLETVEEAVVIDASTPYSAIPKAEMADGDPPAGPPEPPAAPKGKHEIPF